jgi:AcrR family transcriptional regulator
MIETIEQTRSGLRARKKEQTEAGLLRTAIALFHSKGVRGASLAAIARSSEVSTATLFNYFPNKGSLAEAWVRGEIESKLVHATSGLGDRSLRSALRELCGLLAHTLSDESSVRFEAWRECGRATAVPVSDQHPLVVFFRREQERERVRRDITAIALYEMVIDALEGALIAGLRAGLEETDLAKGLRGRIDLILDGARKRNERVTAPKAVREGARRDRSGLRGQ